MPSSVMSAFVGALGSHYRLDTSFQPAFPQGTNSYSAVDVADDLVFVGHRSVNFSDPVLVFDRSGNYLYAFGGSEVGQGIHHDETEFGVHGINLHVHPAGYPGARVEDTVWVTDFMNHTVISYSSSGELLGITGQGASSDPDKFDAPSDAAFRQGSVFFVDGDGGANNRVSRWALTDGLLDHIEWVMPAERPEDRPAETFDHPHSIAWHEASDQLVMCDRDHWRIVLMDPDTGAVTGNMTCDLDLGPGEFQGRPFGVRSWRSASEDLLLVAVAGNEKVETNHQFVHVIDASGLAEGQCNVLQSLAVDPEQCHTPHLIGLDRVRGDVYIACNQEPNSNVLRLVREDPVAVSV